jgi:hypothetical protein
MLLGPYCQEVRKKIIGDLDDRGAAIFRSCGGPGAGGFLTTQSDANVLMDNITFKVAAARRLGGGVRPIGGVPMRCRHTGQNGQCTQNICTSGAHGCICAVGGFVIQRHDRVLRWLHQWLSQGRTSSPPQMEQVLPSEHGRLDVTFVQEGVPWWVDVAITAAATTCLRSLRTRAKTDGSAARDEEGVKRSQYHGRAMPFVLEAHGRAGPAARALIRKFCCDGFVGASESAADAWAALSSVSKAGSAQLEITSYGPGALERGVAEVWIP